MLYSIGKLLTFVLLALLISVFVFARIYKEIKAIKYNFISNIQKIFQKFNKTADYFNSNATRHLFTLSLLKKIHEIISLLRFKKNIT